MKRYLRDNSLWLVGLGLMLASSGIDGAYMERWNAWRYGGYVLNTVADIASMALTYWYGRLQMDRSSTKRRLSRILLGAEIIAVLFSWFFGWRQLLLVMPPTEGAATVWVAPISAGFIPLLLAFVGYAQALLAGRIESEQASAQRRSSESQSAQSVRTETLAVSHNESHARDNGHEAFACPHCGRSDFASQQAVSAHLRWCSEYERKEPA